MMMLLLLYYQYSANMCRSILYCIVIYNSYNYSILDFCSGACLIGLLVVISKTACAINRYIQNFIRHRLKELHQGLARAHLDVKKLLQDCIMFDKNTLIMTTLLDYDGK
jgi:hypothetical protein